MPRSARTDHEVKEVRDRILQNALELIIDDGFVHFSMRRLAVRLGMTAANIYNYFTSKDELYLHIQTKGFEMLFDALNSAYRSAAAPAKRIEAMIRAYLSFGLENPEYYEIMFSRNTPKYADYVGTEMEQTASVEKQTALKAADLTVRALAELTGGRKGQGRGDMRFRMLQVWSTLNGIVNLYNSRVLQEVEEKTGEAIEGMVQNMLKSLKAGA